MNELRTEQRTKINTERRGSRRYALHAPALFWWREVDANDVGPGDKQGGGFTRDVSTKGAYVVCETEGPALAVSIRMQVLLPSDGTQSGLKLTVGGRVVRIGGPTEPRGFAIAADFAAGDESFSRPNRDATRDVL